eukprot:scaffold5017_cov171-Amphora_coffeaeformis.AAC.16
MGCRMTVASWTIAIVGALVCLVQVPDTTAALALPRPHNDNTSFQNMKYHPVCYRKNRRCKILASILSVPFAMTLVSPPWAVASTITTALPLDDSTIDGKKLPKKNRGLGVERMADAINDGIKETEWPVTGNGRPELFSDNFVFTDATLKRNIQGYEAYCRFVRQSHTDDDAKCELVCCSVTGPRVISVLWRLSEIHPELSKLVRSEFTTNPKDGLVLRQVDTVVQIGKVPPLHVLQMQCDWYTSLRRQWYSAQEDPEDLQVNDSRTTQVETVHSTERGDKTTNTKEKEELSQTSLKKTAWRKLTKIPSKAVVHASDE